MVVNKNITYYHKTLNESTRLEEWQRKIFRNVWVFAGTGSNLNKGYDNSNDLNVRIPMEYVKDVNMFDIGDIVALGEHPDISRQSDLEGIEFYNVTKINVNDFGNNPHIHLGGQ